MTAVQHPQGKDIFDDPDLLDFEDPRRRNVVAAKFAGGPVPATVTTARVIMFVQPALPILLPIALAISGGGGGGEAAPATTTTTAAVAEGTAETARRGGGGAFLIFFLGFIGLVVAIIVPAVKLKRPTSGVRNLAVGVEAFLVLLAVGGLSRGMSAIPLVLGATAVVVLALLLAPSTRRGLAAHGGAESSARFDVRNLPELDQ